MSELVYRDEVERLKQFKRELEYFQTNYSQIKREYNNEFIAIKDEHIIEHDSDSRLLQRKLEQQNVDLGQVLIKPVGKMR